MSGQLEEFYIYVSILIQFPFGLHFMEEIAFISKDLHLDLRAIAQRYQDLKREVTVTGKRSSDR